MKRLLQIVGTVGTGAALLLSVVGLSVAMPNVAYAQANEKALCEGSGGTYTGGGCVTPDGRTVTGTLKDVANILIFIVGAVAVLMLIIGGMRYALSGGDQAGLTSGKNTIIYAIVGIVIAVASYAIVNFVLVNLGVG